MPEIIQGAGGEARLLGDDYFLRRVAYAYYESGYSQEVIANNEYCSRQTVSKALQKARDKGIVRISIVPDLSTGFLHNLQRDVRSRLGLNDLVLVAGQNMNGNASDAVVDEVTTNIARAAADYLDQMLSDSDVLGVSGGQDFMRPLVQYLHPGRTLSHLQVVSTIGFVEGRTTAGDANQIAHDLALAYGATHVWFPAPAILATRELMEQARALPIIHESYQMMQRANVLVMSLWTPHNYNDMVVRNILTQEQVNRIMSYRPAMDINHWVFDARGNCLNRTAPDFPYFLTGLEIPDIKDMIQRRNIKVVLLAGGNPSFVPAIRSALRARLANILITDHITAQLLLSEH